ncbi:MAG TPA: hypothetical protein VMZ53_00980 [Kofleriaceae bacterium]|nr:hypothetical protein [Kofleriaceae bacterium]
MIRAFVVLALVSGVAVAQPAPSADPSAALREANDAATQGDWTKVDGLVQPLLAQQLDRADLAEAHRLAGISALFAQPPRRDLAESHFVAYLKIDLDGHLDPALYPPDVVNFFNDVRAKHSAELKAIRPKKRYAVLSVLPPFGQFQNGERTKGWVITGVIGTLAIADVTAFLLRRSWCTHVTSPSGNSSYVCDGHYDGARATRTIEIATSLGLLITYVYGVYDGVRGYRRESRERALMPYASPTNQGAVVGVQMNF